MVGVEDRALGIHQKIGPALAICSRAGLAVESPPHVFQIVGNKERRARNRLEKHGVMDRFSRRWEFSVSEMKPTLRGWRQRRGLMWLVEPPLAIEFGQCDSAP